MSTNTTIEKKVNISASSNSPIRAEYKLIVEITTGQNLTDKQVMEVAIARLKQLIKLID